MDVKNNIKEYRGMVIVNSLVNNMSNITVQIIKHVANDSTNTIKVGFENLVSGKIQRIQNRTFKPSGVQFIEPIAEPAQIVASLAPGEGVGLWIERFIGNTAIDSVPADQLEAYLAALPTSETFELKFSYTEVIPAPILTVSQLMPTDFRANWQASAGATGYLLDVCKGTEFVDFLLPYENLDVENVLTYLVENLQPGDTYSVRVMAYNENEVSAYSNIVTVEAPT